jgi:hypothetical protein
MRDLVALSALPAIWSGLDPQGIASSLSDVLLDMLSLAWVYLRLGTSAGQEAVEVLVGQHPADKALDEAAKASLRQRLSTGRGELPAAMPDPLGSGTVFPAVIRFGVGPDHGVLVAASRQSNFPTEQERLLLGVGANQAAIVVQRRQGGMPGPGTAGVAPCHAGEHRRRGHRNGHRWRRDLPERRRGSFDRMGAARGGRPTPGLGIPHRG